MQTLLPFGLPSPTAGYLALYLVTLVLHVVFMNYVLAGTAYLAVASCTRGQAQPEHPRPVYDLLRDWMPFVLGAAITAGVAPILFVQVLYPQAFYTANLLLFHRWMAILPALLIGFYLLYLLKSDWARRRPRIVHAAVGIGALACFAFTGWSWTENHLLSIDQEAWVQQYASGSLLYRSRELGPRMALWFAGAVPTMAVLVGWQLRHAERHGRPTAAPRSFAWLPLAALGLSAVAGSIYYAMLDEELQIRLTGPLAGPYLRAAAVGWAIALVGWLGLWRCTTWKRGWLAAASGGWLLAIVAVAAVREARRLAAFDIAALEQLHERAASVGGLGVFVAFLLLNAAGIAACVLIVRHGLAPRNAMK